MRCVLWALASAKSAWSQRQTGKRLLIHSLFVMIAIECTLVDRRSKRPANSTAPGTSSSGWWTPAQSGMPFLGLDLRSGAMPSTSM